MADQKPLPRAHRSPRELLFVALMTGVLAAVPVLVGPGSGAADSPADQARGSLARAAAYLRSISAEGGYLWWYSEDLTERRGEEKATPTQVWVQPPGTPSVGAAFLRAYAVTKDRQYLAAAGGAASALATGQLQSGGWDYVIDFDPVEARKWLRRTDAGLAGKDAAGRKNVSTFDDDNTQSALRFLMEFLDAAKDTNEPRLAEIRQALDYGLAKALEAQYPNGAWPQRYDAKPRDPAAYPVQQARIPKTYPREWPRESYYGHYTLNDNTQRDTIRTMLQAYRRTRKPEFLQAAKRGGDFLILAQVPAPQAAWAQQYNARMEPAWARAFEPASVCSSESAGAIRTLVELYTETGDRKYLKPVPAAADWFNRSQIAPGTWARLYELKTNKPIYGDRDGKIHYTLEEISEERRRGYSWRGAYGIAAALKEYEQADQGKKPASGTEPRPSKERLAALEAEARQVIASLDDRGRWVVGGRIPTRDFIRNVGVLCDYLEAAGR